MATLMVALTGCGPTELTPEEIAAREEERRLNCIDRRCNGDVLPPYDAKTEEVLKYDNRWFIGPSEYFSSGMNGGVFHWPSKTPARGGSEDFPEREAVVSGRGNEVEITVRPTSVHISPEPRGYAVIQLAEERGWIASRKQLRPGLEVIEMKQVSGPHGRPLHQYTFYVATDLVGPDGLPPVAMCNHTHPTYWGSGGLMWRPRIAAGILMNQKHCEDWPEIYQEAVRVLELLREVDGGNHID